MEGSTPARANRLLSRLGPEAWAAIHPHLEARHERAGAMLITAGEPSKWVYFPVSGVIARMLVNKDDQSSEFSLCGSEGAVGLTLALDGPALGCAMVLFPSQLYRCPAQVVADLMDSRDFRVHMLRYTRFLIDELMLNILCNKHHSIEQQLSRWLLMCVDRLQSGDLYITHELIARLLGVRREGVTEAAGRLRAQGIVELNRGHIRVKDTGALQSLACDCYGTSREKYRQLLLTEP